jgi:hypothetical protein
VRNISRNHHLLMSLLAHELNRELEAPAQNCRHWMLQFGKPEGPVLSFLIADMGTAGVHEGALPTSKQCLDGGG